VAMSAAMTATTLLLTLSTEWFTIEHQCQGFCNLALAKRLKTD